MHPQPQSQHEWLQKFLGEWTSEAVANMGPDKPTVTFTSTEVVRSIGGLWIACEAEGQMPGGGMTTTIMTLGYDPARQRFVGTFLGSMMTHLWVYEGQFDSSGRILTLDTEGPDFSTEGKMSKYQDIIELKSDDHRLLTAYLYADDGSRTKIMTANYWRKK